MQIDKTMLDRLLSLDDVTLSRTIASLAAAAGVDSNATAAALGNLRLVRQSLANATDADLKKAMDMLNRELPGGAEDPR